MRVVVGATVLPWFLLLVNTNGMVVVVAAVRRSGSNGTFFLKKSESEKKMDQRPGRVLRTTLKTFKKESFSF